MTDTRRRARVLTRTLPTCALLSALPAAVLTVGLLGPASGAADDDDDAPDDRALAGVTQVAVKLAAGQSLAEVTQRHRTRVVDRVTSIATYLLEPPAGTTPSELVSVIEADPELSIEWVEPNYADGQPEGNPTYKWSGGAPVVVGTDAAAWRGQRSLRTVGAAAAHQVSTGAGTLVAVVDTGFELTHPALASRFTRNGYDFVDDDRVPGEVANGIDDDQDGRTDEGRGHGTHVAGMVVAVAPSTRIMPLRVLDDEGTGYVWTAAEAIRWASARGADVINLSLGTSADSELLEDAVEDAEEEHEVVVVASAGNDARSLPQYPAADDDALAVGSVRPDDTRSPFSNFGTWVDVAAPGQRIVSPFPGAAYARWDGTSMAAPIVSGQAALLRAQRPAADADEVAGRIRSTAVPVDAGLGGGRVSLAASLWP